MRGSSNLSLNLVSFLLGFLAGTLFWWIVSKIRSWLPRLREVLKQRAEEARQRTLAGIGLYVREAVLRRAQKSHLASALFSLDEIIVPPKLLAPPRYIEPSDNEEPEIKINQVLPYLPDWPELASQYNAWQLTPAQALEKGVNIAIIGQPGSGKTVALAHFASQLARQEPSLGSLIGYLPIFFHILDINYSIDDNRRPVDAIVQLISSQVPPLVVRRIPGFVKEEFEDGKIVLLIDGMDELHPVAMQEAVRYLTRLLKDYPKTRFICAASSEYLDGLIQLGVYPLALAAWNTQDRLKFVENWSKGWQTKVIPEIRKHSDSVTEVNYRLFNNWLTGDSLYITPFDWTLKTWALYAGDIRGSSAAQALDAYIDRIVAQIIPRHLLEGLAAQMILTNQVCLHYSTIETLLLKQSPTKTQSQNISADESKTEAEKDIKPSAINIKSEQKASPADQAIIALANRGMMIEHYGEQIRFAHPIITGYLASFVTDQDTIAQLSDHQFWSLKLIALKYLTIKNKAIAFIQKSFREDLPPLHRELMIICHWLSEIPPNAEWRANFIKHLINLLHREATPFGIRAKIIAAFVASNDPSISLLFKQLITSKSDAIRQLAALGCGAVQDTKIVNDLLGLFTDPVDRVRIAACAALGAIGSKNSLQTLKDIFAQGDEDLRQIAAEYLATRLDEGPGLLYEATESPDLLTRRSAIYGLTQLRDQKTMAILEKMAIEDAQWVVRNSAGQALESMQKPLSYIPHPLPPPSQAAWLIKYASQLGVGIGPEQPVTDMLLQVLRNGSVEERISALLYLRQIPDTEIIKAIYELVSAEHETVADSGLYALWLLSLSGIAMPETPPFSFL